jgi:hypothetical protein
MVDCAGETRAPFRALALHRVYLTDDVANFVSEPERSLRLLGRLREYLGETHPDYRHYEAKVARGEALVPGGRLVFDE